MMPMLTAKCIGNIDVEVYQTPNGEVFFYLQGDNKDVLPIRNYLENSLENY